MPEHFSGQVCYPTCPFLAHLSVFSSKRYWQDKSIINPLYTRNPLKGTLANSEDPSAAFQQGLHHLLSLKQPLSTEIYHLENPVTLKVPYLSVSICMGKHIRIQRVNYIFLCVSVRKGT